MDITTTNSWRKVYRLSNAGLRVHLKLYDVHNSWFICPLQAVECSHPTLIHISTLGCTVFIWIAGLYVCCKLYTAYTHQWFKCQLQVVQCLYWSLVYMSTSTYTLLTPTSGLNVHFMLYNVHSDRWFTCPLQAIHCSHRSIAYMFTSGCTVFIILSILVIVSTSGCTVFKFTTGIYASSGFTMFISTTG